jgi:putative tryptophan/tyrosine transport system substrate-binding protein
MDVLGDTTSVIYRNIAIVLVVILTIGSVAVAPSAQESRPRKLMKIGRLSPLSAEADAPSLTAFRAGMRELGWTEGTQYELTARFADGKPERLREIADELVRDGVDVIVSGSNPGALAAKSATSTIPIVMVTTGDPVAAGVIRSLARPGGNITGLSTIGQELTVKRLELLKEAVPGVSRVAVLVNPHISYTDRFVREREGIARTLGIQIHTIEVSEPEKLAPAFAAMSRERVGALMVLTDVMFITRRRQIVRLASQARIPAVYPDLEFVTAGGLMFYGSSIVGMYHQAATYVDKVLKGAKPADLPVEQPTTLELVVNLKAAKQAGITVPRSLIARADRVIE